MSTTVRARMVHAATVGLVAAVVASAAQYFIAIPVGNQPDWLWALMLLSVAPSLYLTYALDGMLSVPLQSGTLIEVATPFGPAFRVPPMDIAVVALGTVVVVGLCAYLANGLTEMIEHRH